MDTSLNECEPLDSELIADEEVEIVIVNLDDVDSDLEDSETVSDIKEVNTTTINNNNIKSELSIENIPIEFLNDDSNACSEDTLSNIDEGEVGAVADDEEFNSDQFDVEEFVEQLKLKRMQELSTEMEEDGGDCETVAEDAIEVTDNDVGVLTLADDHASLDVQFLDASSAVDNFKEKIVIEGSEQLIDAYGEQCSTTEMGTSNHNKKKRGKKRNQSIAKIMQLEKNGEHYYVDENDFGVVQSGPHGEESHVLLLNRMEDEQGNIIDCHPEETSDNDYQEGRFRFTLRGSREINPLESSCGQPTPYQCETCGKYFTRKFSLNAHLSVHNRKSNYKCPLCQKFFLQLCHLKEHMRAHRGLRPHTCDICNKKFTRQSDLNRHIKMHSTTKEFGCPFLYCGRRFSSKNGLQYHLKTHSANKPYHCDFCGKDFFHSTSLNSHFKRHFDKQFTADISNWPEILKNKLTDNQISTLNNDESLEYEEIMMESYDNQNQVQQEIEI